MRNLLVIGGLVVSLATTGAAQAQGKADSPSEVLGQRTQDFARCVTSAGVVRLILRLDLDQQSQVEKVEIESETALPKSSRRCIERVALQLSFAPELAGKTIEHGLQVVNSGRRARR